MNISTSFPKTSHWFFLSKPDLEKSTIGNNFSKIVVGLLLSPIPVFIDMGTLIHTKISRLFESNETKQARKIQSLYRGYLVRKKLAEKFSHTFLPSSMRSNISRYLKKNSYSDAPRAFGGNTRVYLPTEFPDIVIKCSGPSSYKRLCQMNYSRAICEKKSFKHLVIPKAQLHSPVLYSWKKCIEMNLIVEQRLPIQVHIFEQSNLYCTYHVQFTEAIKEFVNFKFLSGVSDLIGASTIFRGFPVPRYDNFSLYRTTEGDIEKYQIGLVDLEHVKKTAFKPTVKSILGSMYSLVYFFPYHAEIIINEAKKFIDPALISDEMNALNRETEAGKNFLKIAHTDLDFYVQQKPQPEIVLSSEKKQQIINEILKDNIFNQDVHPLLEQWFCLLSEFYNQIIKEKTTNKNNGIKDRVIYCNTSHSTKEIKKLEWDLQKLKIDKTFVEDEFLKLFFRKLEEHKCIYHYHIVGFSTSFIV